MAKNPMKKRYRSWQPTDEPPAPRRRRYPQLVVRDGTGHHIAHDIATAPKVELPLPAIVPAGMLSTRKPPMHVHDIEPHPKQESEIDELEPDSPVGSASTLDRPHHNDGPSGLRSPFSPPYEKSRPRNDVDLPPSGNAGYRPTRGTSPATQSPHAPVSGARVNPVVMHSQGQYPVELPSYPVRPRTSGGYAPYESTCYPPPSGNQPMGSPNARSKPSYPARKSPYATEEQARRYSANVADDESQRTNAYQTQSTGYAGPQAENRQPASEPQAPRGNLAQEKVILAGKRCGTVEYWRSSLQMPREKGVIKSLKAPPQYYRRKARQGTPEHLYQTQPVNNTPPDSTSVPQRASTGQASGYPLEPNTAYQPQGTMPDDYTQNHSSSERDDSSDGGESQPEHKFWRSATKLPPSNIDSARMKKLASGKRRVDEPSREGVPTCVPDETPTNASPPSGRQYGTPHQPGYVVPRETEYAPQTEVPVPQQRVMKVNSQPYAPQREAGLGKPKAQSETRRLLFLRDFEMQRLKTIAQGKFHVKMNLRGRAKLQNWICSDEVSWEATNFVLSMFNTDRRVLSKNDDVRRNALYDMSNEDLRILEALMARIHSRGGRQNWETLVRHLPYEDFVNIPLMAAE